MDFTLSEEQQMIVDSLGKYAQNELKPIAEEYRDRLIPKDKMLEIKRGLLDFGVGPGVVSEELGGMGLNALTMGLLQFEVAKAKAIVDKVIEAKATDATDGVAAIQVVPEVILPNMTKS